jgi:uncharacterized protein with ATP-grasp and redox domains
MHLFCCMQHMCYAASITDKACMDFTKDLKKCNLFSSLGDNAGEIVFDKLLIEAIKERYDIEGVFI